MADRYDLIIRNGILVTPGGQAKGEIAVKDGRIAAIDTAGGALAGADADRIIDAANLHILPGIIDTQVHFREPGLEHKEDLATGTLAGLMGGVTTVFEMPNTKPSTARAEDLAEKLRLAQGRAWTDHAFFIGATNDNCERLAALEQLPGCCGVKIFMGASTGDLLVPDDPTLTRALRSGVRRIAIHAEDEERMQARRTLLEGKDISPALHPLWRDALSALRATQRIVKIARETGRRVHILHVTTAEEMIFLAQHKDIATVEVTPQHLTLEAPDCYDRLGSFAQMNPPIRDGRHRAGLWAAVQQGIVDVVGSDHAPHTREEKARPYPQSPSGMPGVQTMLPLMLDHVAQGRLTLERMVDLLCHGPQRIYGIAGKGRIAVGYDADLCLVDLKRRVTIEESWLKSRCGWSPFTGMTVTGWPVMTILRGHLAMREGEALDAPQGRPVRFVETLAV